MRTWDTQNDAPVGTSAEFGESAALGTRRNGTGSWPSPGLVVHDAGSAGANRPRVRGDAVQTLDRDSEIKVVESSPTTPRRKRHWFALAAVAVVLVVISAAIAYAVGSSNSSTKTIVRVGPQTPTPANDAPTVDDRGFHLLDNGHQAEAPPFFQPMDAATFATLQNQLKLAQAAAMQYPTVASAEAAGFHQAGPFAPGLGAHFINFGAYATDTVPEGPMTDFNALHPQSLIYDGTHPDSKIAGLMYYGSNNRIPQGFAGINDVWHYHTDVCFTYKNGINTPFGADTTVTKAMCDGVGGSLLPRTAYMLHVWVVPGYESPQGVFSHLNEAITCRDGSYHTIDLKDIGNRTSVCVDGGE